jgi:hypothetical protein
MRTSEFGRREGDTFSSQSEKAVVAGQYFRASYVFIGLLVAYVIVRGVVGAVVKPFWFDELLTLAIAGQPSLQGMWHALTRGFDSQAPGFYLVEHAALKIVANKQIALRLPSILAFPCTLICVFVYTRKRAGDVIACVAALLLLTTSLFHTYLIEARGYSMMLACIAFAMVCYQRLPSRFWAVMLAVSFFVAETIHYYTVFSMIPFGLAEGVFCLRTRRVRWTVWLAFAFGTLPLIIFWPLLENLKRYYGPHIFSHPVFSAVRQYYAAFFLLNESELGMALALVAITGIFWSHFRIDTDHGQTQSSDPAFGEKTLALGLIVVPFIVFVVARVMHSGLLSRYVLAAALGVVLGLSCATWVAGRRATALFALSVACVVGVRESRFWRNPQFDPFGAEFSATSKEEFVQVQNFVQGDDHLALPVVFTQGMLYCQIAYYSPPDWTSRLVYLADEEKELATEHSDTLVKAMEGLSEFFPLRIERYSKFVAAQPEFLLYSEGADWTTTSVLGEAVSVRLLQIEGERRLYLVKMNGQAEK